MKTSIKVVVTRHEEKSIEVDLPIYSQHDLTDEYPYVIYYRREADRTLSVKYSDSGSGPQYELHIERTPSFTASDADYILGRGEYASSANEFNAVLAEAIAFAESMK